MLPNYLINELIDLMNICEKYQMHKKRWLNYDFHILKFFRKTTFDGLEQAKLKLDKTIFLKICVWQSSPNTTST